MERFSIAAPADAVSAIATVASNPHAAFIAGGTTMIDLMKHDVTAPQLLVDIDALPYAAIERTPGGGVRIGALARMSDTARHDLVRDAFPAVSSALLASASGQLRNMASIGGNLMQRTRCPYFRDTATACNKRKNGEGCTAIGGENRGHSVVGTSDRCICTHASDLAVALVALEARVHMRGPLGDRVVPLEHFYLLPGATPQVETVLRHGELITGVELPPSAAAARSVYVKVRDRASYEFALVSAAAALDIAGGTIRTARLAFGGIAPVPWRSAAAERALAGRPATREIFARAASIAMHGAVPRAQNGFKIKLAQRTAIRALSLSAGLA